MAELEDIDGVGPARSKSLREGGYESPEDLVDADPEKVAEYAGISKDNALETIVQAQNMVEDDNAAEQDDAESETISDEIDRELDAEPREAVEEVEESEDEPDGSADGSADPENQAVGRSDEGELVEEGVDEESTEEDDDSDEDGPFDVTLDFDDRKQYDVFHAAIVKHWSDSYDTRVDSDLMRRILDDIDGFENAEMELSRGELNNLHSAIHQERVNYQGSNRVEQLNLLKDLENKVNEVREEELF